MRKEENGLQILNSVSKLSGGTDSLLGRTYEKIDEYEET